MALTIEKDLAPLAVDRDGTVRVGETRVTLDIVYAQKESDKMKLAVIVHEAEEGGYWAEVPAIPGCATQGESFEELLHNLYEAVDGCLSVPLDSMQMPPDARLMEIAV